MRTFNVERITKETAISISLNLDGTGKYTISTPVNFLTHMLELFSFHSGIDLDIQARSLDSIQHHLVEDVAIVLGNALRESLSDKCGIARYGSFIIPMDETLIMVALDLSGRSYYCSNMDLKSEFIEDLSSEMVDHFFKSLTDNLRCNLHINLMYGVNEHHKVEGAFKALARALKQAISISDMSLAKVASTKGVL